MKSVEERNKLNGLFHKWRVTLMFHHIKPHYYHTLIDRAPNHTYQLMKNQAGKSKKNSGKTNSEKFSASFGSFSEPSLLELLSVKSTAIKCQYK